MVNEPSIARTTEVPAGLQPTPQTIAPMVDEPSLAGATEVPAGLGVVPKVKKPFDETDQNFFHRLGHGKTDAVLSLLSGIAAMGTAPTRSLGVALASGLGAGAQAYQGQRQFGLEKQIAQRKLEQEQQRIGISQGELDLLKQLNPAKYAEIIAQIGLTGAQTGLYGAQTARTRALTPLEMQKLATEAALGNAQAKAVMAGQIDITPVPNLQGGVDYVGFDKITRQPIDVSGLTNVLQGAPSTTTPAQGTPAPAGGGAKPTVAPTTPVKPVSPQAPQGVWKPTADLPPNFSRGIYILPGYQEQKLRDDEAVRNQQNAATQANHQIMTLKTMEQQMANLPEKGWQVPGAGATERQNILRSANAFVQSLGGQPIADTASGENLMKFTNALGASLAHSVSGRASGQVIDFAIKSNPGIENSKMGFKRLISAMNQAAQYEKLMADSQQNYFSKYQTLQGWRQAFDKANPPQYFAQRAVMNTADPRDVAELRKNPKNTALRQAFDAKYGNGVSRYFVR